MATESEIAAIVNEIRDRVRARHPQGEARGIGVALPDLLPILHARDAAAAKVAAIGSVNPRPSGVVNNAIQTVKRTISRSLGWFVRDQVEFNRGVLVTMEATLEALNDMNRTFVAVGARLDDMERGLRTDMRAATDQAEALATEARELKDIRAHWVHWREEWQQKLFQNEVHFLRGLTEMQASVDLRLHAADANYRETVRQQHAEFTSAIEKAVEDVHSRFWAEMEKVRLEYERLIHEELRIARQKAFTSAVPGSVAAISQDESLEIDYMRFAERFRGSADKIRERLRIYTPHFEGKRNVLDIGCGRGEFLELMAESGVPARGVDLDAESVALCRSKGLRADVGDVFEMLALESDGAFDGIFAAQVIEHIKPWQVPRLVKLCASKLKPGGVLAFETPNPECLSIFATHFYLDPTHQKPLPPALMVFYFEEFGFGAIKVKRLAPAVDDFPSLKELSDSVREQFFGGLDYAILGRRL